MMRDQGGKIQHLMSSLRLSELIRRTLQDDHMSEQVISWRYS